MSNLTEEHKQTIDLVAKQHGFSTNYELIARPALPKGGNFLGVLTAVTVKDGEKTLELILKSVFESESSGTSGTIGEVFTREIFLYTKVLEEFRKFQEESGITDCFNSIPKIYRCSNSSGKEFLLMENLKTKGYGLWNKILPMNNDHVKAVLKEYAKYHAVSLAMRHKKPELFHELTRTITRNMFGNENVWTREKVKAYMDTIMKTVYSVLSDNRELSDYVKKMDSNFLDGFMIETKKPEYRYVVDHGDCWCNNFMFKYEVLRGVALATTVNINVIDLC